MSFRWVVVTVGLVAAGFGAGWLSAASGRAMAETSARDNEIRANLSAVRAEVLAGRVSLYQSNVGDAMTHFEHARTIITRVEAELREIGEVPQASQFEVVVAHLHDAERMTGAFDPHAQDAAAQATETLASLGGQ